MGQWIDRRTHNTNKVGADTSKEAVVDRQGYNLVAGSFRRHELVDLRLVVRNRNVCPIGVLGDRLGRRRRTR